jgi:hypothetical protein
MEAAASLSPIHFGIVFAYAQPLLGLVAGTPAGLLLPAIYTGFGWALFGLPILVL